MSVNPNASVRECCDLTFCDFTTGVPFLRADYALTTTTEMTANTVYATGGRGNPRRITFNSDKGGTMGFSTQIVPFKLYSLLSGAAIETTATFLKREVLAATAAAITLTTSPVANTVNVFAEADDCGTPLEITVEGTTVTLPVGSTGNFIAYYVETISTNVKKLNIKSTTFPNAFKVYAETIEKTESDEILPFKMTVYKAIPQPNFSINLSNSGDPMTLEFTADLLADSDDNMLDLILIEDAE